jgi:GNAT superfamily N-acetyltransferase
MPNFRIETFRPEYTDQVIMLIDQSLKSLGVIPAGDVIIDDPDLRRIPDVYAGRGRFWVALEGDTVIGTVAVREVDGDTAKLNRMFVQSRCYGQRVGQQLLDCALDFAKAHGFREIVLNTHVRMERAHHFYEKNGFVRFAAEADKYHYQRRIE